MSNLPKIAVMSHTDIPHLAVLHEDRYEPALLLPPGAGGRFLAAGLAQVCNTEQGPLIVRAGSEEDIFIDLTLASRPGVLNVEVNGNPITTVVTEEMEVLLTSSAVRASSEDLLAALSSKAEFLQAKIDGAHQRIDDMRSQIKDIDIKIQNKNSEIGGIEEQMRMIEQRKSIISSDRNSHVMEM